ncbi:hypothetical protein JCM3770_001393 [Rhodotorula araucariae]
MHALRLLSACAALLLASVAWAADLSIRVAAPSSFDIVTRYVENVHRFRPDAFYPFLHQLAEYKVRVTPARAPFSDPAFAPLAPGLDGKPRKGRYSDHNPIFTRLALANESHTALEGSLPRLEQWKKRERGRYGDMHLALAAQATYLTLQAMRDVWARREPQAARADKSTGECQSWADVGGARVCSMKEFWALLGHKQGIETGPLKVQGDSPETFDFDRFLPAERDASLPLVVLYAATTDEAFPALFEGLYALANTARPRLQLALRWKPDTAFVRQGYEPDFAVEAIIQEGVEMPEVTNTADFTARAISYIRAAQDKFDALNKVATTLPLVAKDVAATLPRGSLAKKSSLGERITLNGIAISPATMTHADVLALTRAERKLFQDITSQISTVMNEERARDIILTANVTLEAPRKSANSLAIPTVDKPLRFVNLAEALKDLTYRFQRASYLEGVGEESEEDDPAAIATFWVVADLDSDEGRKLVANALRFAETTGEIRLSFVHNPSTPTATPDRFALSSLIASLVLKGDIAEAYPQELLAFLELNASDEHPPRRSLSDMWTAENPMTPFVEKGVTGDLVKNVTSYWADVAPFAQRVGVAPGEAAVILNGRFIGLDKKEFATGSFHALHQYELKRRIKPVHEACIPAYPEQVANDRRLQADMVAVATSIAAGSADIHRQAAPTSVETKGLATIVHGSREKAMFEIVAVLDPLGPLARQVAPFLQGLKAHTLVSYHVHLLPASASSHVDLATLSGRWFPSRTVFGEDQAEAPHSVDFTGLPVGAVLDVKAYVPKTGEQFPGPGGKGGESVKIDDENQVVVFTSAGKGAAAQEEKGERPHVRDEL